jgi:hypothetical protein
MIICIEIQRPAHKNSGFPRVQTKQRIFTFFEAVSNIDFKLVVRSTHYERLVKIDPDYLNNYRTR